MTILNWQNLFPAKQQKDYAVLAKELNVVIIASLFEKRAQGIYHNTTAVIDADGTYLGQVSQNAYSR